MSDQELQPITSAEISPGTALSTALLALNNEHAQELSWLEPARLQHLVKQSFLARRIGNLEAFLLAFDQSARYDSPNFLWLCSRYPRFVYVDRIVVASFARGRGHARRLYDDLFSHAVAADHARVVCEVNTQPPNPASDAFYAALDLSRLARQASIAAAERSGIYRARCRRSLHRADSAGRPALRCAGRWQREHRIDRLRVAGGAQLLGDVLVAQ